MLSVNDKFCCSKSLPTLGIIKLTNFSHSGGCIVVAVELYFISICFPLVINIIKYYSEAI